MVLELVLIIFLSKKPWQKADIVEVKNNENTYLDLSRYNYLALRMVNKPKIKKIASQPQVETGAPENLEFLFDKYSGEYGVDKQVMKKIAACESGFRQNAVNGPYAGMYQFVAGTWVSNRRAMGLDSNPALRYNAEESIKTTAFKISRDGTSAWPLCSR